MRFIAKQPNGRYCVFSTIIGTVVSYNLTADAYVEWCAQNARKAARNELRDGLKPFSEVKDNFEPICESYKDFNEKLKDMGETEMVGTEYDDEDVKQIDYGNKEDIPADPF